MCLNININYCMSIYKSLVVSILVQFTTGIIQILSMFIAVPVKFLFLKQLMVLEIVVQCIEGLFYMYWWYNFKKISNITPKRYLDWSITTPTMLINLMFYLIFLQRENDELDFFELFKKEWNTIVVILTLNWMMLLLGYLGEISVIPVMWGVALGFIPFLIYFYLIYKKYAQWNEDGLVIFFYFLFFWSLYGVVAVMPYKMKNMCYNVLDLFSKNFFGLFLTYLLLTST